MIRSSLGRWIIDWYNVAHHNARGSRRFRCDRCDRLHVWPQGPKAKVRVPEVDRDVLCPCGLVHTR